MKTSERIAEFRHPLSRSGLPFSGVDALRYFDQGGYAFLPIRASTATLSTAC